MSYNNFIPTVWSEKIQRERERACIAAGLCWKDFEGDIKDVGDTVRINGVSRPTVGTYTKNSTTITPENLDDNSQTLSITQSDYFAFEIDDVDKRQGKGDIMSATMQEAAAAMAETEDSFIYGLYAGAKTTIDCSNLTSATIIPKLTTALKTLWGYSVPKNEEVYLEVSPSFLEKLLLADINLMTPNDGLLKSGFSGVIPSLGTKVYMSNGVYNDGTFDYCFLRTRKAIAIADQFSKTEAYRPENAFSDAVKGLHLYGAKVIRPKELVVLKASYAAEA